MLADDLIYVTKKKKKPHKEKEWTKQPHATQSSITNL